jgi:hypothetical protein
MALCIKEQLQVGDVVGARLGQVGGCQVVEVLAGHQGGLGGVVGVQEVL